MAKTRVVRRTTKTSRNGELFLDKTTIRETSTLGKVVKIGLIAGAALLVLGAFSRKK